MKKLFFVFFIATAVVLTAPKVMKYTHDPSSGCVTTQLVSNETKQTGYPIWDIRISNKLDKHTFSIDDKIYHSAGIRADGLEFISSNAVIPTHGRQPARIIHNCIVPGDAAISAPIDNRPNLRLKYEHYAQGGTRQSILLNT